MNTHFQRKKIPKKNIIQTFVSDNAKFCYHFYPKTLFEECTSEMKKNNLDNLINDDLDSSSSDESDNESDHYEPKKSS